MKEYLIEEIKKRTGLKTSTVVTSLSTNSFSKKHKEIVNKILAHEEKLNEKIKQITVKHWEEIKF